ncbi:MAG: VIT1/CCC1 transporter family protein [Chloroflexi bacterium]|nr:VIT1/CCC1 transporter family protein [Chloroflexota bacterium]
MTNSANQPLSELEADHTTHAIGERLRNGPGQLNLRDFILGAIDGTVTTFAVVAGVSGAELAAGIVIILGVANLVADGFSMGVSLFLGTRAENQQKEGARRDEERQIDSIPEGEKEEVRQIFAAKGFSGDDLERGVEVITADRELWVNTMLQEEHGFAAQNVSPWRSGLVTYAGFMMAGLVPLLPYFYGAMIPVGVLDTFTWSIILAFITFFAIGALKTRFVEQRWYWGGLETLAVGGVAAGLAYLVGVLLRGLVDMI